jgi:hypothetical protein
MPDYPKDYFDVVDNRRQLYELQPTAEHRANLAWWVQVLAARVAEWELNERISEKT